MVEQVPDLGQSQEAAVDVSNISQKIKSLADDVDGNPETQKQLNDALTDAAINDLKKLDSSAIGDLKNSVLQVLENHGNQPWFEQSNAWFVKLAGAFWLQKNDDWKWEEKDNTTWTDSTEDVEDKEDAEDVTKIELPASPLNWTLDWITSVEIKDWEPEDKIWEQNFYKWKGETLRINESSEEWKESALDTTKWVLQWQIDEIILIDVSKLSEEDKAKIEGLQNFLLSVKNVINNTTSDNVKKLQQYIFDNLNEQDKAEFWSRSRMKSGDFDGKFWKGTLTWLDKVLEKTWKYIDEVSNTIKESKDQEDLQKLNAVKANPDISYIQWSWDANLKSWLSDLPEWAKVSFKDDNEKAKLDTSWEKVITLRVEFNWQTREDIVVHVNVTDGSSPEQTLDIKQPETQPISVDGKQYLPMENKPSRYPEWAVFYSAKAYSPETSASEGGSDSQTPEAQPKFAVETTEIDGDSIYYMKVGDNTYEVKIDKQTWTLCPVAKNIDSWKPVIFEGNNSCKSYLFKKMPQKLQDKSISISWNGKDYVMWLGWYNKKITIEPMTIAWLWLKWNMWERWATITEGLAFLNLTNYLRNVWKYKDVEFRNDNPDLKMIWDKLYVRVNRRNNVSLDDNWNPVKNWKWLHINKEEFWLTSDTNLIKRFIKYNNHEDWNDNRDRKTPNKYYTTVKLQ